jgi:hypothetical protein
VYDAWSGVRYAKTEKEFTEEWDSLTLFVEKMFTGYTVTGFGPNVVAVLYQKNGLGDEVATQRIELTPHAIRTLKSSTGQE